MVLEYSSLDGAIRGDFKLVQNRRKGTTIYYKAANEHVMRNIA